MRRLWAAAPLLWLLATPAWAWNDLGHDTIAIIAYRNLTPPARARLDAVLAGDPRHRTLMDAAVWPDVERTHPTWHYVNIPYHPGQKLGRLPKGEGVVTAIADALKRLRSEDSSDEGRADALSEVIHFVGDIHQPLHTVARFDSVTPNGDRGGNDVHLQGQWRNLHALWDNALNVAGPKAAPEAEADTLMARYPLASMKKRLGGSLTKWAYESARLAVEVVYTVDEKAPPTADYLAAAKGAAEERVALAGYRLAALLNKALK